MLPLRVSPGNLFRETLSPTRPMLSTLVNLPGMSQIQHRNFEIVERVHPSPETAGGDHAAFLHPGQSASDENHAEPVWKVSQKWPLMSQRLSGRNFTIVDEFLAIDVHFEFHFFEFTGQ